MVAYRQGLRVSELVDLKWDQVDLAGGRLHVNRLKNGNPATHYLEGDVLRALRRVRREYADGPFVFTTERGWPLTRSTVNKLVERAGRLAKLGFPVHPHMLRPQIAAGLGIPIASAHLGSHGIALFALAGAAGVIIAPAAGRAGDRGLTRPATLWAHLAVIAGLALAALPTDASASLPVELSLLALVVAAVLVNLGGVADQALGRRAVNMIRPEARGRVNGLFTGSFFVGGALGAALAGPAWAAGGWMGVCAIAAVPAVLACALRLTESDCKRPTEQ